MSNLTAGYTIVEMAKNIAPDGTQMRMAMTMAVKMAMLQDIIFFASNDVWMHKSLRSAKLPSGSWRGINEYVTPGIGLTDDVTDVIGIIDDFATYDKLWIDRQPDPRMARLGRAKLYIEGIAESIVSAFLYGNNAITPKKPHGLAPRMNATGRQVISNGGSATLSSLYVVTWGEGQTYGVYPKNGETPEADFLVKQQDMGVKVDTNSNGNKLVIYEDHFTFEGGIAVEDPRTIGRVANINVETASAATFENDLIKLTNKMETGPGTRVYMNEDLMTAAQIRMKDKGNVNWGPGSGEGLFGKEILDFNGIPVRKIDSKILLSTEDQIS